jgi:AcrR family transcriptional regulator
MPGDHGERNGRMRRGEGREALLDAAIRVVAATGLRGLTIRSVSAEAGVTHGLVRHHFGSRGGLVDETVRHAARISVDASALEPGTGSVEDMASHLGELVQEQAELQAFQFELLLEARRRAELLPHMQEVYDDYIAATQRELERAGLGDDIALARAVFAAFDGLVLQQVVFGRPGDTRASVDQIHEMLRALIRARTPADS